MDLKKISPLLATYDEKLNEKDEKLRFLKVKLDDVTKKFQQLLEENSDMRGKLENLPGNVGRQMDSIKTQAQMVLEENNVLNEKLASTQKKLMETEKARIQEVGRLSKRIVAVETERVHLLNQMDGIKMNSDTIIRKYNEISVEASRKVELNDHLNQIGDLRRKIEEVNLNYKTDIENFTLKLQVGALETL